MEASKDPNIHLITGDLGFGVLEKYEKLLPCQYTNVGVAEQSMLGLAAGMASTGKRVFVYSIGNFPTMRALEQVRNDVCYMNNPVVIVSIGAGYSYGAQGYTHHALEDIAVMRAMPGMEILTPSDSVETVELTKYLTSTCHFSYLRLGRSNEKQLNKSPLKLIPGEPNRLIPGNQGSILFVGSIGELAIEASHILKKKGRRIGVYSVPFLSALSAESLKTLANFGLIVTIEEHTTRGGFGSSVLENASENGIKADVRILGTSQYNLSEIGDQDFLRKKNGLSVEKIVSCFAL